MKTIKEIGDIRGKKILVRADLDVAVINGQISESFRIEKQKETIDYIVNNGGKVVMVGHISDIDSFGTLLGQIETILGRKIVLIKDLFAIKSFLGDSALPVALLENIRKFEGERENSEDFAKRLGLGFDIYINNAFAVCHRNQASISAITKFLPSFAGFQLEKEVLNLGRSLDAPMIGKVVIMGGAKAESKIPVIKAFLRRADKILIGGVIANDYLKAKGFEVGESKVDADVAKLFIGVDLNDPKILAPKDFIISDKKILDIGPKTIEEFTSIIKSAKMIIWNGPVGMFEDDRFSEGTRRIAEAVTTVSETIVGGGDTISAIDKYGLSDRYKFVSTGGGAMLEFLAGNVLPGIVALNK